MEVRELLEKGIIDKCILKSLQERFVEFDGDFLVIEDEKFWFLDNDDMSIIVLKTHEDYFAVKDTINVKLYKDYAIFEVDGDLILVNIDEYITEVLGGYFS